MPLDPKPVDRDDFETILSEAVARIPVHTPEWTHFNQSDPGITLVELFAFMAESLLYRANRIPERNRLHFLKLLRLGLRPAEPARGFVTFDASRGPREPQPQPAGLLLEAGRVPFRTTTPLTILPLETRVLYKRPASMTDEEREEYLAAFEGFRETDATELRFYQATPFPEPRKGQPLPALDIDDGTVDRCVWIALLAPRGTDPDQARDAIGGAQLTLGIVPVLPGAAKLSALPPESGRAGSADVVWEISTGDTIETDRSLPAPRYLPLVTETDVDVLERPGTVRLTLPPAGEIATWRHEEPVEEGAGDFPPRLEEDEARARVIAWIRMRFRSAHPGTDLHWLGVNAAEVVQAVEVRNELVGRGTGEPDQVLALGNTSILPRTLELEVEELDGEWIGWGVVEDLLAHGSEARVFTVDRESGEMRFGDGINGRRPPRERRIRAAYQHGGGARGNVPLEAINRAPALAATVRVANPLPTWGGADPETTEEGERRIPAHLRHRDRAVSSLDFEDIARRAPGVEIGRIEVLPVFHPDLDDPAPGTVTLLVLPRHDPLSPAWPRPDSFFLRRICEQLEPRRLVTTEVHVVGPCYVPVWISVGVRVRPGFGRDLVVQAVRTELSRYLSPLEGVGGPDREGWPLGKSVLARDLEAVVTRVRGVEFVRDRLRLASETAREVEEVPIRGLELPRLVGLSVTDGDPVPIDQVVGDRADPAASPDVVPIPVVPESC